MLQFRNVCDLLRNITSFITNLFFSFLDICQILSLQDTSKLPQNRVLAKYDRDTHNNSYIVPLAEDFHSIVPLLLLLFFDLPYI